MTDTGRIVAVTGASSGIGLAAARLFRDRGDKVYCLSRTDPKEPGITFIHTDVTDEASVNAAFGAIGKAEGRTDVLLSNAGIGVSGAAECTTMQDAKRQLCFFAGGMNVPASVVVADDLAAALEHELENASALDAPLGTLVVLLHPVVKNVAAHLDAAFFPHGRFLLSGVPGGSPGAEGACRSASRCKWR